MICRACSGAVVGYLILLVNELLPFLWKAGLRIDEDFEDSLTIA
jgi:hypothetical protein